MQGIDFPTVMVENIDRCDPSRWFAVRVKSQHERAVALTVRHKGFEEFLPLYQRRHRWSDRWKSVEVPLFPGYVFCRLDPMHRLPVLTVPGVLYFVGIGKTPAAIDDGEMLAIQSAVRSGLRMEPWAYLDVGQRVRLEEGPLAGLEGILVDIRKECRVVVSLSLLKRSVSVEIERHWLSPVGATRAPAYMRAFTA